MSDKKVYKTIRFTKPDLCWASLIEIKEWLDKVMIEVPEQYHGEAIVDLNGEDTWFDCFYKRPENQEEEQIRLKAENLNENRKRDEEIALLVELKKKYETRAN